MIYLFTWVNKYKVQSNTLYTAIFSLNYYKGFSVIRTIDINETAEYILRMCDKFHREKKKVSYYESGEKNEKKYVDVIKKEKEKHNTGKYRRNYIKSNTRSKFPYIKGNNE